MTSFFVPELIAAYPNAKFILTTRDPQRWVRSVNSTMLRMTTLVKSFPICYMGSLNEFMASWIEFAGLAPRHIWKDKIPGDDREAIKSYNAQYVHRKDRHSFFPLTHPLISNALVRQLVPRDRLLVVRLEDGLGWEEICPFLGHGIPSTPYPRGNDPKDFGKMVEGWLAKGVFSTLATAVALVAPMIALSWYR